MGYSVVGEDDIQLAIRLWFSVAMLTHGESACVADVLEGCGRVAVPLAARPQAVRLLSPRLAHQIRSHVQREPQVQVAEHTPPAHR